MTVEEIKVKTWSLNETRCFREWLRRLKGRKIRIVEVRSAGDIMTAVRYEILEAEIPPIPDYLPIEKVKRRLSIRRKRPSA